MFYQYVTQYFQMRTVGLLAAPAGSKNGSYHVSVGSATGRLIVPNSGAWRGGEVGHDELWLWEM